MITSNFRNIGQTIGGRVGVFSLRYPRDHGRLPELRAAVMECVGSGTPLPYRTRRRTI
jgi:hypothetical protein